MLLAWMELGCLHPILMETCEDDQHGKEGKLKGKEMQVIFS